MDENLARAKVLLRPATSEDADEVAGVHVRSWQVGYRGILPDAYLDGLRLEDRAARYTFDDVDPHRPATIVAVEDGIIRGFATTGPARDVDAAGAGELLALYVDPESWRQGVGRRLIAAARVKLRQQGYGTAILWALEGNDRAARFYAADGWLLDGTRRTEAIWGVSATDLRYRRALP
jgi:GNAT superfamily N-acetyltransferase